MRLVGHRREGSFETVADARDSSRESGTLSPQRLGMKEEEERGDPSTLVAALADLPHFKEDMNFEDWVKTARNQKVGENDEEYAKNLQHLAERAFKGCPPNRVTNWLAVQFRAGVRPPIIAAKLHAMKTNNLNQLVEAAARKRQDLFLTSVPQTAHRRPNPPRPRWTPSRMTPREGERLEDNFNMVVNACGSSKESGTLSS
ncbi:hypothetical protein TSMEX_010474 [Taenia solium]|eukprot:TsM_000872400 transcript=TsM_000872400 gene=TsM_000872400